jgi:hypothetical protein
MNSAKTLEILKINNDSHNGIENVEKIVQKYYMDQVGLNSDNLKQNFSEFCEGINSVEFYKDEFMLYIKAFPFFNSLKECRENENPLESGRFTTIPTHEIKTYVLNPQSLPKSFCVRQISKYHKIENDKYYWSLDIYNERFGCSPIYCDIDLENSNYDKILKKYKTRQNRIDKERGKKGYSRSDLLYPIYLYITNNNLDINIAKKLFKENDIYLYHIDEIFPNIQEEKTEDTQQSELPPKISGSIYLFWCAQFILSDKNVYKIGKTRQSENGRLSGYPKGSKRLCEFICEDSDTAEKELLVIFRDKFKSYTGVGGGNEYFEGNWKEMQTAISDYLK